MILFIQQMGVRHMDSYTVKQVSDLLKTNEETVRRWIRSGKLTTTFTSKKGGHIITGEALNLFVKETPKYAPILAASLAATASRVARSVASAERAPSSSRAYA